MSRRLTRASSSPLKRSTFARAEGQRRPGWPLQPQSAAHPQAVRSPRGPELDARIDDPGVALVYVEAKWNAEVGTGKGKAADVPDDQIVLRCDSFRGDPSLLSDERAFAVLGISERKPDLVKWHEPDDDARRVSVAWLTWDELAECPEHPLGNEFRRYLAWKRMLAA